MEQTKTMNEEKEINFIEIAKDIYGIRDFVGLAYVFLKANKDDDINGTICDYLHKVINALEKAEKYMNKAASMKL